MVNSFQVLMAGLDLMMVHSFQVLSWFNWYIECVYLRWITIMVLAHMMVNGFQVQMAGLMMVHSFQMPHLVMYTCT